MRSVLATLALLATDRLVDATGTALTTGQGYLAVPIGTIGERVISRRAVQAYEDRLSDLDFFYATEVSLGNPPQRVQVLVDTGSSELWVNPDCTTAGSLQQTRQCEEFGKYDPRRSKNSYGPLGKTQLKYGDPSDESTQSSATLYYYADTVGLGGANVSNQTFGVVSRSNNQSQGIIGLAPDLKGGYNSDQPYSLVLSSMAAQGVIASRVYALDLRHSDKQNGAVIFGGLDRSKFIGSLEKRPIVRGAGGEYRLAVELTSVGVTLSSSSSFKVAGPDANVLLDSGTTLSRLHATVAEPVLEALDARDDGEGYFKVPCSMQSSGGSVDFGFGGKTIRVPFKDFIINTGGRSSLCYVGVVVTRDQQILGDSVLRAGYFVFDWDNQQVHLAQAADCGQNDIVAVSSGTAAVPSVTGSCKDSDAAFTGGTQQATPTKGSLPTKAYTTVYTITSCPLFDLHCATGLVTTQSLPGATATGSKDKDKDNAAAGIAANTKRVISVAIFWAFIVAYSRL